MLCRTFMQKEWIESWSLVPIDKPYFVQTSHVLYMHIMSIAFVFNTDIKTLDYMYWHLVDKQDLAWDWILSWYLSV